MDGGHHLPVGIEGNLRQPGPAVSDNVLIKAIAFSQPYQCGFRGIADLVVTADGGIAAQQGRPQQRLLYRVMEIGVLRVDHPSAGIQLLDRHAVLRQRTGLIRADHGHAAQPLHRLQMADDGVFLGHFPGAEGQHNGDDGAERLGDGRYCQRDGKEEGVHHVFVPPQHADGKQHRTDHQNDDGELPAELIQTDLQRGFPFLRVFQQQSDLSHFSIHAGGRHQEAPPAIGDEAAGKHHVLPVPQRGFSGDLIRILFHRQAFASKGAFRTLQTGTFQQTTIRADGISRFQYNHITGNYLSPRDLYDLAVPQHLSSRGGHLLEAVQRGCCLDGLNGAQNCIHGDDR